MQTTHTDTGKGGEAEACRYLVSEGYEILERNWRYRKYEVDIIAKKGAELVFVEVKTRKSNTFGEPEVFVTRKKQQFLISAASQYVIQNDLALESRFDIISVVSLNNNPTVKHLQRAFYPILKKTHFKNG